MFTGGLLSTDRCVYGMLSTFITGVALYTLTVYKDVGDGAISEVFSVRIPRELKRLIKELEGVVDWRREVVEFLQERVRYYKRMLALKRARSVLERHPELPKGTVLRSVRGDRDSH